MFNFRRVFLFRRLGLWLREIRDVKRHQVCHRHLERAALVDLVGDLAPSHLAGAVGWS